MPLNQKFSLTRTKSSSRFQPISAVQNRGEGGNGSNEKFWGGVNTIHVSHGKTWETSDNYYFWIKITGPTTFGPVQDPLLDPL